VWHIRSRYLAILRHGARALSYYVDVAGLSEWAMVRQ
jgi:hypothetical protein